MKGEGGSTRTGSNAAPWSTPDGVVVAVVSGASAGALVPIPGKPGRGITIGSAKDNALVITDPTVSRRHATLERTERGIIVRDLGSKNGVRIAGARITEALLEPGTSLMVGDVEVMLRVELTGAVIPPSEHAQFGVARGRSLAMRRIFGVLERFAPADTSVLLMGETGTGKDVLARSIHEQSPRATGPFEVVDCGAITPTLIESELFGHEKGAFTGAVAPRQGAFERAHGGTVFLDEIGELPLALQPKLLRALEAREIRRVGGSKTIKFDARVIAATTRDLTEEVAHGTFRQDLFFRVAVVPLHVPPLRQRLEDIELLAAVILQARGFPKGLKVGKSAVEALRSHPWPGNVRELRNVLERAAHLAASAGRDTISELPALTAQPPPANANENEKAVEDLYRFDDTKSYHEARGKVESHFEERYVLWLLERHGGNISAAARAAKMDRKYLSELVRRHRRG